MTISSNSLYGTSSYASYRSSTTNSTSSSSSFAEALLTSLDSDGSGSIDSTEFSSAALALANGDQSVVDNAFSSLDSNQDGTVSTDELSSLFEQNAPTMAAGSMPPPPPQSSSSSKDAGLSADEMSSMLESVSSSDSHLASLLSTVVSNFDAADTDSDVKVTFAEAMSYQQSTQSSTNSSSTAASMMAAGSMPPPPPSSSQQDTGLSADEMTSMLKELSSNSGDSDLATLLTSVVNNFDAADTDGDGKVTFAEAMSYQKSQDSTTQASTQESTPTLSSSKAAAKGYTKDELTALSSEVASSDSNLSSLMQSLAQNFDAADTNQDGVVSAAEAQAYNETQKASSTQSTDTSSTASHSGNSNENMLLKALFSQIMANYASQNSFSSSSALNFSA